MVLAIKLSHADVNQLDQAIEFLVKYPLSSI